MKAPGRRGGFSLIEAAIAILVAGIALAALAGVPYATTRTRVVYDEYRNANQAILNALNRVEASAPPAGTSGVLQEGGFPVAWTALDAGSGAVRLQVTLHYTGNTGAKTLGMERTVYEP